MGDWSRTTIGEVLVRDGGSIKTGPFGTVLKAHEYSSTGVPVVSVGEVDYGRLRLRNDTPRAGVEVTARLPEFLLREGDIVFGRKGAVDRNAIVLSAQEGWFLGSDGIRLRLPATVDARFVSHQLQSKVFRRWIRQHATGTTMPSLNQSVIERIPVTLPSLDVQRRVAGILGAFDDKIELNLRLSEMLEATARTVFRSWFVDFDSPQVSGADDWVNGALVDLADLNPEVWPSRDRPSVLRYVDLSGTKWGRIGAVTDYPADEAPSRAQRILRPGDTIVGTVRPGNGSYALVTRHGLTGSTGFAQLRPKRPRDAAFVYLAATARANIDALAHLADGGAYPAVRPAQVVATPVVVPDDRTLQAFSVAVSPFLERAVLAIDESEILAAMRDALLPRLLSGELVVAA